MGGLSKMLWDAGQAVGDSEEAKWRHFVRESTQGVLAEGLDLDLELTPWPRTENYFINNNL
jgi:hypothetical protein